MEQPSTPDLPKSLARALLPSAPPLTYYIPNFLTPTEQESLLQRINSAPLPTWRHLSHRRLQAHPSPLTTSNTLLSSPLPSWLQYPIISRLSSIPLNDDDSPQEKHHLFTTSPHGSPNHCLINEYTPGQGIHPHEDGSAYQPVVATVSLGSPIVLDVYRKPSAGELLEKKPAWRICQEPGSTTTANPFSVLPEAHQYRGQRSDRVNRLTLVHTDSHLNLVVATDVQGRSDPLVFAQDELQKSDIQSQIVMNHEPAAATKLHEAGDQPSSTTQRDFHPDVNSTTAHPDALPARDGTIVSNDTAIERNDINVIERSDSEAETVVLDDRPNAPNETLGKVIKNEDNSDGDEAPIPKTNGFHSYSDNDNRSENLDERPSLKRKRPEREISTEENAASSNLSSTTSSPAARAHSSQSSESDSDRRRTSPSTRDEAVNDKKLHARKRRLPPAFHHQDRNRRGKSDPNSVPVRRKERRETRSATHHEQPRHRSESPPSQRHKRAQSTQSIDLSEKAKRKPAPPPLLVERRRKTSEDPHGDSDDSSSIHSHPHLQKVTTAEHSAMSPAKLSYKKNRDKNGRTILARACALDVTEAKKWLTERPQDIDVPDNAGNTPLQIASLEGLADVVQLLLDAGCDTSCKNIDLETPLIDAVENGHLEVIRLLLNAGLDPRQCNAKGEEPLDLINPDDDEYEEIRAAIVAAKESSAMRRPSEDQSAHNRDNDLSSIGASAASPTDVQAGKSPPPSLGLGPRRRTARSQPTQEKFLWINPTPAKLREACGKGDLEVVAYILRMSPEVGTDAVIAAARAGHDVVLEILFAIGQLEHDPDPVESGDFKPGQNTPMLAAIGRGHIAVTKLLVSQRGFNPTRRIFKGLSYHELAKERKGSNWEEEYTILKEAHDDYLLNGGRRSNHSSPRKVRVKKAETGRSSSDASVSPTNVRQLSMSSTKTAPEPDIKREHAYKAPPNKHLRIPEESKDSAVLSDRDSESTPRPEPKPKAARSVSDVGATVLKHPDATKPRRKLLSRNDIKSDRDIKRRASLAVESLDQEPSLRQPGNKLVKSQQGKEPRKMSESTISAPKVRKDASSDLHQGNVEPGKKRSRLSNSPRLRAAGTEKSIELPLKKKKRRVDSEGNAIIQDPLRSDTIIKPGGAMVANMIASPEQTTSSSEPPGKAPVANMGVSSASPITTSPTRLSPGSGNHSPMTGIEQTLQLSTKQQIPPGQPEADLPIVERREFSSEQQLQAEKEAEDRRVAEIEQEAKIQEAHADAAQKASTAKAEEEARLEQQRRAEEAERQAQREQDEEEARIAKKQREEESAKRRAEQERLRREEQERRRAEQEQREQQRRIQLQEEEQQQLRDALPNSLRRAAELSPEMARQPQEARKWLPLYTATTSEIDPECDENMADERWVANVQVAPILAIKDLDLSQCKLPCPRASNVASMVTHLADTAWTRIPATPAQRQSLWRQVRNIMSQATINRLTFSQKEAQRLDEETYPKFRDLKSVFWIKLSDFKDIVPRHPHLTGLFLRTRAMVMHQDPWGNRAGDRENKGSNGEAAKEGMSNGYR
ncbi:MAG: hypothetical protein Q9220_001975 [cf. Caloplaca sp. 1 TL-2023]